MRKTKRALVLFVALMLAFTSLLSLNGATASAAAKCKLDKKAVTVLEGSKTTLKVKNKVKSAKYKWTSSNKKVATVSSKGIVTAKAKGTAKIQCKVTVKEKSYTLSCKVTVLRGAAVIRIQDKKSVAKIKVGDQVDLNRKMLPKSSNDKTFWTSSDETIAKPDKVGKFTALKAGTVTITATTLSGEKDQVTIQVFGGETTVSTQQELEAALKENYTKVTIATQEEAEFVIPKGDYTMTALVVDAPKADVTNKGRFATVTINQIKSNTWYEDTMNNMLTVTAPSARVVVNEGAKANIVIAKEDAKVTLVNNGILTGITVNTKAEVQIQGTSKSIVKVQCNAKDANITTNVPVELTCSEKITLNLQAGAEGTVIRVANEAAIPVVTGTVTVNVIVGEGEEEKTVSVNPTPSASQGTPEVPQPTPEVPQPTPGYHTLSGVVTREDTLQTVSGASIRLAKYDGSEESYYQAVIFASTSNIMAVSGSDGRYSFDSLANGHYIQVVAATGCAVTVNKIEITDEESLVKDVILKPLADGDASKGTVTGNVIEAITNQPVTVSGGSIRLVAVKREDPSVNVETTIVTGSAYKFENLSEGTYDVTVTDCREGIAENTRFKEGKFTIFALGGAVIDGQNCYLVNSNTSGSATFVLTWGQYPEDLDSHLVGKDAAGNSHHICFYNMTADTKLTEQPVLEDDGSYAYYASKFDLRLDVDDVTSYGPETTSIYHCNPDDAWYTFFVHNYTGNSDDHTLFNSLAQVSVVTQTQSRVFSISEIKNGTDELVWVVCRINAVTGEIQAVNEIHKDYKDINEEEVEFVEEFLK